VISVLWRNIISAIDIIIHPTNYPERKGIKETLVFYYSILPIPILVLALVSALDLGMAYKGVSAPTFWSSSLQNSTGSGSVGSIYTPIIPFTYLITYPIVGFINAGVFHFLSKKVFKIWSGNYNQTFTAVIFGFIPVTLFLWVLSLPLLNLPVDSVINLVFLAIHIWNAVITIKSFQIQHSISLQRAVTGYLVGMVVIFFIMTFYYNFNITWTISQNMIHAIFQ
jgi:hypothetical protein